MIYFDNHIKNYNDIVAYVGVLEAHQRTTLPALIPGLYPREFEDGDL